jgi:RHS repeat-associated protein
MRLQRTKRRLLRSRPETWDKRNRLTSAGGTTYTYDAENRRISSTANGQTTTYVYSRGARLDRLLAKVNPDGSVTRYVYGAGLLYEETTNASGTVLSTLFYHFDWRGDTVALSDASGNVVARMSYSPYGERTVESGTVDTLFCFNGKWGVMTEPNQLLCMQARFYSPVIRRFLNEDPSGFAGGSNMYAFAGGDPIDLMDPFGLGPVNQNIPWTDNGSGILANGYAAGGQPNITVPFGPDYNHPVSQQLKNGLSNIAQGAGGFVPLLGAGMDGYQAVQGTYTAIKDVYASVSSRQINSNPDPEGLTRPNFNLPKGPDYSRTGKLPERLPEGTSDAVQGALGFTRVGPILDGYQLGQGIIQITTAGPLPNRK